MKHTIQIKRTAHYYSQLPDLSVQSILFVIHGYAQLASDFLSSFHELKNSSTLVIAPEAISKFYNKEKQVVANWMTSLHRDDEIHDYVQFLNQLLEQVKLEYPTVPVAILGFSQGVSTTIQWINASNFNFSEIHLCSGTIPPELDMNDIYINSRTKIYYYYGLKDRLLKPEKARKQITFLETLGLKPFYIEFEGRHEIPMEAINQLWIFSQTFEK